MSIESGARDAREEAYRQMEEQKNMANQPQREGELPPVLAPENANKAASPEEGNLLAMGDKDPMAVKDYVEWVAGGLKQKGTLKKIDPGLEANAIRTVTNFWVKEKLREVDAGKVSPEDFLAGARNAVERALTRAKRQGENPREDWKKTAMERHRIH